MIRLGTSVVKTESNNNNNNDEEICHHEEVNSPLPSINVNVSHVHTHIGMYMRVITCLAVLFSALYIILSHNYDAAEQRWAFGAVGTVLGYWFKT